MDEPDPAPDSMTTSWPWRTNSFTPAGVIATRYSWFLTSRGIPTFMTPQSRAGRPAQQFAQCKAVGGLPGSVSGADRGERLPGQRLVDPAQRGPAQIPGLGGGEYPDLAGRVRDVTTQYHLDRLVQRHLPHGHPGLLVLARVPAVLRHRGQVAGQEQPDHLAG